MASCFPRRCFRPPGGTGPDVLPGAAEKRLAPTAAAAATAPTAATPSAAPWWRQGETAAWAMIRPTGAISTAGGFPYPGNSWIITTAPNGSCAGRPPMPRGAPVMRADTRLPSGLAGEGPPAEPPGAGRLGFSNRPGAGRLVPAQNTLQHSAHALFDRLGRIFGFLFLLAGGRPASFLGLFFLMARLVRLALLGGPGRRHGTVPLFRPRWKPGRKAGPRFHRCPPPKMALPSVLATSFSSRTSPGLARVPPSLKGLTNSPRLKVTPVFGQALAGPGLERQVDFLGLQVYCPVAKHYHFAGLHGDGGAFGHALVDRKSQDQTIQVGVLLVFQKICRRQSPARRPAPRPKGSCCSCAACRPLQPQPAGRPARHYGGHRAAGALQRDPGFQTALQGSVHLHLVKEFGQVHLVQG